MQRHVATLWLLLIVLLFVPGFGGFVIFHCDSFDRQLIEDVTAHPHIAFTRSLALGLEWLVVFVVFRCNFPENGELFDSSVLDLPILVVEFLCDHIAEDLWNYDVELLEELDDLEVCVTRLGEEGPQGLDDVSAVVLVSWCWRRVHLDAVAWHIWETKFPEFVHGEGGFDLARQIVFDNTQEDLDRGQLDLDRAAFGPRRLNDLGEPGRHVIEGGGISVLLDLVKNGAGLFERRELLAKNEDVFLVSLDLMTHLDVETVEVLDTLGQAFFVLSILACAVLQ